VGVWEEPQEATLDDVGKNFTECFIKKVTDATKYEFHFLLVI
jgi:hypothetical protein